MSLIRLPLIIFNSLVYGLYFLLGVFAFIRFQYGEVSWLQALSIVRGNVSLRELNLAVITNFLFLATASLTAGWIFLKTYRAFSVRPSQHLSRAYMGAIAILTAGILGISSLWPTPTAPYQKSSTANGLAASNLSAGSDVVHIFVESLVDKVSKDDSTLEVRGLVLEDADLWITNGLVALPGHDNTITGLISAWCAKEFPVFQFNDPFSTSYGMKDSICLHDVLRPQGFEMQFASGYDSNFQAKNGYLDSKNVQDLDLSIWQKISPEGLDSWNGGLNDKYLFNRLKSIVQSNYLSQNPFYLSALTLDTHPPLKIPSYCPDEAAKAPLLWTVYECVAYELAELVSWLRDNRQESRPLLVVIQGDHLPGSTFPETSKSMIFFAAACFGGQQEISLTKTPGRVAEISSFIVEASHECAKVEK